MSSKLRLLFHTNWDLRIIWTCLYVMLWQWITLFEPYWYEETIQMSRSVLGALWCGSMLFPVPSQLLGRVVVGVPLMGWLTYVELKAYELWPMFFYTSSWQSAFISKITAYHPYVWFLLGLWLCCEVLFLLIQGSGRLVAFLLLQITVFGILDSFTNVMLWEQVAWLVGTTLIALIAVHVRTMTQQFPHVRSRSVRYPLQMGLSALFLISLIISLGISVPTFKPILTDPYTAWTEKAEQTTQTESNMDGSNPSEMEGDEGLVIPSLSGYGENDGQLGGAFQLDYTPIMTVSSDARGYWRGETKDVYTGLGWIDGGAGSNNLFQKGQVLDHLHGPSSQVPTKVIKQTFQMEKAPSHNILFGMSAIQSVHEIKGVPTNKWLWNERDGEMSLMASEIPLYPESYTLFSQVPIATEEELREASKHNQAEALQADKGLYVQLPPELPKRVSELAHELTAGETNDYDRAKKIETYLRTHFQYTTTPTNNLATSRDFVDSFLFDSKEGYCDYFSTSMAVMLRSIGVPTRWVKGYAPGTRDGILERMTGSQDEHAGGTFRVTNADAHSWVEVYLGDYGWVAFEPTPGFTMTALQQQEEEKKQPLHTPEEDKPKQDSDQELNKPEQETSLPTWIKRVAQVIVLIVVTACMGMLLWRWSSIGFSIRGVRLLRRNLSVRERIVLETELWLSYCRMRGLKKEPYETVREAAHRWSENILLRKSTAEIIVRLFEEAKYGTAELSDSDLVQLKMAIKQFKRTC
ncbi:DUF4129 domain-containing transglutaminase family protein [Paenibacillus sp. 481]|uniref:DUF4129 domain-containing transglutaminase family protein n=1 Tax=Paenibacillus sp. 481 TaxID=2835869 RepID=UPI001E4F9DD3|nr:transglutaminase domain-containing protein [Paenibacillus sp. 481]UHA74231.1 transglutaminase domain-containing protein [Paenibacillus sp. 481]